MALVLNPLTSMSKAISKVSIKRAQFPELTLEKISLTPLLFLCYFGEANNLKYTP